MSGEDGFVAWVHKLGDLVTDAVLRPKRATAVAPGKIAPSPVTNVHATVDDPRRISLVWTPPLRGTPPFGYTVFYRVHGAPFWAVGALSTVPRATISNLKPATRYEFEVLAHNN